MPLLDYKDVINEIQNKENHLLIGNGFNYGLGINTGYGSIFKKMVENNQGLYNEAMPMINECCFDLEEFIGRLEADINNNNTFLKKYVRNKVKFDFMQATHEIVKSEIKTVYSEKNEGIFILLRNFTNYFSLNYDSFLYLLLLKHKLSDNDENNSIAFQPSLKFIKDDFDVRQNNIYTEIKKAREEGRWIVNMGDENATMNKPFSQSTKTSFANAVKEYAKSNKKGWKTTDIDRVVTLIIKEEQQNHILPVDDGFRPTKNLFDGTNEWVCDFDILTQNLFFLHGAFHIYSHNQCIKKVTQDSDKALYDKLEEIINNEGKDIVCVFQHKDKTDVIENNGYLQNCLNKLGELKGNMVIIGSSLADNDNHIFEKINISGIETVYISTLSNKMETCFELAKSKFSSKNIVLFDAETISYEFVDEK